MGERITPEKREKICDRCKQVIERDDPNLRTLIQVVELMMPLRRVWFRYVAVVHGKLGPRVLESHVHFCGDCWDAWSDFMQGRATPAIERHRRGKV